VIERRGLDVKGERARDDEKGFSELRCRTSMIGSNVDIRTDILDTRRNKPIRNLVQELGQQIFLSDIYVRVIGFVFRVELAFWPRWS
jgi:hypothetical protein